MRAASPPSYSTLIKCWRPKDVLMWSMSIGGMKKADYWVVRCILGEAYRRKECRVRA